jgi:chromosome segregation ATPase
MAQADTRQIEQLLGAFKELVNAMRDQSRVLIRLDNRQHSMMEELQGIHTKLARVLDRLEQHEQRINALEIIPSHRDGL